MVAVGPLIVSILDQKKDSTNILYLMLTEWILCVPTMEALRIQLYQSVGSLTQDFAPHDEADVNYLWRINYEFVCVIRFLDTNVCIFAHFLHF